MIHYYALVNSSFEIFKYLVSINKFEIISKKSYYTFELIKVGNIDAVKYLISHRLDISIKDRNVLYIYILIMFF